MANVFCALNIIILIFAFMITECICRKEEECIEVGFARASFSTVNQGYEIAKKICLDLWQKEDKEKKPYHNFTPKLKNITRSAHLLEEASKQVIELIQKTRVGKRCPAEWLLKGIEKHVYPLINLDKELAESLGLVTAYRCMIGSPYPNVDGTCVNQESPDMGANGGKFLRLIPTHSGLDGFSPRQSVNSALNLPSANKVSKFIKKTLGSLESSILFTEFGHFIQSDTFNIPESPQAEDIDCCATPDKEDCAPIQVEGIPEGKNKKSEDNYCINFRRSAKAQAILGHRESFSTVSTYLDATPVYASTNEDAFKRKTGLNGLLKDEDSKGKSKGCDFPNSFKNCFRVENKNYVEGVTSLLRREHNYIAKELALINKHFDDSLLYNEARRILIAEYNCILYNEYLPVLMGPPMTLKHSLQVGSTGPGAKHIPEVNPGILTSFALAAYRNALMHHTWFASSGPTDLFDSLHLTPVRHLPHKDFLALDVQRSRDQGLAGYATWTRFCENGYKIHSWDDMAKVFAQDVVDKIKILYNGELEDVDLSVALLEPSEEGAVLGKTFNCILADQFARLKTGNRMYWEHESSVFTAEQQQSIKTDTTARALLCRHLTITKVPKNPFLPVSLDNPLEECSQEASLDFYHWTDTSLVEVMQKVKEQQEAKEKGISNGEEAAIEEEPEPSPPQPIGEDEEGSVKYNGRDANEGGQTLPFDAAPHVPQKSGFRGDGEGRFSQETVSIMAKSEGLQVGFEPEAIQHTEL